MPYPNNQLKQSLAKMLPNLLCFAGDDILYHCQHKNGVYNGSSPEVLDTELLHLCWLVEDELIPLKETDQYEKELAKVVHSFAGDFDVKNIEEWNIGYMLHATWQQRVIALCRVKGIDIA